MRLIASAGAICGAVLLSFALAGVAGWPGGRPLFAELGSTLGIAALVVFAVVIVLPTRIRPFKALGADAAVRLHRHLVGALLALLAAHIVFAVALQPARWKLLQVVGQPWRAQVAVASVACLAVLIAVSVWRRRLRLRYSTWRALHGTLALAGLLLAGAHTFGWQRYLMHGGGLVVLVLLLGVPVAALLTLRFRRPAHTSYVLEQVVPEAGQSTTLHLRAEGHDGQPFRAGQFAWLRPAEGAGPFAEHPFSYTSSAEEPARIQFTVRAYQGFTARAAQLAAGTRFHVDGPHGGFRLDPKARGALLVAYGIGITPSMSILRTAADRCDTRRYVLLYANRRPEDVTFAAELDRLSRRLDLEVVHVLSRPPETWIGERGRITSDLLLRRLPAQLRRWDFFLCGAGAPVDSGVEALTLIGVPPERIHAERFVEV